MDAFIKALFIIASPIFFSLLIALILVVARRTAPTDPATQGIVLQYNWLIKSFAIASSMLPVPGVILLFMGVINAAQLVTLVVFIVGFSLLAIGFVFHAFWTKIAIVPEGIIDTALRGSFISLRWDEVVEVKYCDAFNSGSSPK